MAGGYIKLFGEDLLRSTVWQEAAHVRLVWITLMCLCDDKGAVSASVPGLAREAGVSIEQCEEAISRFLAPDRYSRTKEHEGRRVEEIDGGWRLLNHAKYRAKLGAAEQRAKAAERMRAIRAERANKPERQRTTSEQDDDRANNKRTNVPAGERHEHVTDVRDPDPDPDLLSLGSESPPSGLPDPGALVSADLEAPPPDEPPPGMELELPAGWRPAPDAVLERRAAEIGVDLEAELRKLHDHCRARGTTSSDWQASWRGWWCERAFEFARRKPAHAAPPAKSDRAARELAATRAREDRERQERAAQVAGAKRDRAEVEQQAAAALDALRRGALA